jgi:hypothetical protein
MITIKYAGTSGKDFLKEDPVNIQDRKSLSSSSCSPLLNANERINYIINNIHFILYILFI